MVPSDWKQTPLSELTKEKISYGIVQAGPHVPNGVPYIKSSNVGGEIDVKSLQKTAKEIHYKYRRSAVHPNDIVFSLRGNIARTSIVPYSLPEANLTQGTARISVNDTNDMKFIFYQLASTPVINRINALSKGSTFKEISLEELRKVKLPEAPLKEQQKIAQILSTWDKAISITESLIANSQQQKKSLMQQLLTGKKRFPGFEEEWEEIQFKDLSKVITKGTTPSTNGFKFQSSGINFVKVESIIIDGTFKKSKFAYIQNDCHQAFKRSQLELNDILFSIAGALGRTAIVNESILPANTNQALAIIRLKKNIVDVQYAFYQLSSSSIKKAIKAQTAQAAQPNLSLNDVGGFKLKQPCLEEQQKIASTLTAADNEIDLLQQKLTHLKQEKKALMQQLLTGKRRVKFENKTEAA